jgi:UDP-glucose 6-dehydrogenase
MNIIIQGYGVVGDTIHKGLQELGHSNFAIHDPYKGFVVSSNSETMKQADVLFYCVNEPDGRISDGTLIEKMVGKFLIIKTTLHVGETELIQSMLPGVKVVYMPEFLREDSPLTDFHHPDHLVFGSVDTEYSREVDRRLFIHIDAQRFYVEPKEAELIKLISNVYPLIKLAFFNQVYDLCEKREIDYQKVIAPQKRNKFNSGTYMEIYNKGGRGGGGKCLPKDLNILLQSDISRGLLREVKKINDRLLADCPKKR